MAISNLLFCESFNSKLIDEVIDKFKAVSVRGIHTSICLGKLLDDDIVSENIRTECKVIA